ncbi:MAG: AraC family transcriptional regulator [Polyangiaceae bacterium]
MDRKSKKDGYFIATPLSPWLRLAHVWTVRSADATHLARLRVMHDYELFFQVEGSSWIYSAADGGSVDLQPGDIAFIPPGLLQGWGHEAGRHIAVHFDLHARPSLTPANHIDWTDQVVPRRPLKQVPRFVLEEASPKSLAPPLVLPLVTKLRSPKAWLERLGLLVDLWSARDTTSLSAALTTAEVIGWAVRTLASEHRRASHDQVGQLEAKIVSLVRAIDVSAKARPSVRQMAQRIGVGPTAFRAAFLRALGRTPARYLEERRIERAARTLVETDVKILSVARAEGYGDPYHFSRVFSRVMGVSPREYRRRARAAVR